MPKYRHYIKSSLDVSYTEVFPLGFNGVTFDMAKDQQNVFFRRTFNGSVTFRNDTINNINDYTLIKSFDDSNICQALDYKIDVLCNGEYETYWTGTFASVDCEFDVDNCVVKVSPQLIDDYGLLLSNQGINVIDTPNPIEVRVVDDVTPEARIYENARFFDEVLEYVALQSNPNINGIISDFFQINPVNVSSLNYVTGASNKYTRMALSALYDMLEPDPEPISVINPQFQADGGGWDESDTSNPVFFDWSLTGGQGKFIDSSSASTGYAVFTNFNFPSNELIKAGYEYHLSFKIHVVSGTASGQFIQFFIGDTGGVQYDTTTPDGVYEEIIIPETDGVLSIRGEKPIAGVDPTEVHINFVYLSKGKASQKTTRELISFNDLTNDLRGLFNVFWLIDENRNIRLEHISFFNYVAGLNLTTGYDKYISGTNKYSYDTFPRIETWTMFDSKFSGTMTIDSSCGNISEGSNINNQSIIKLYTDYYAFRYEGGMNTREASGFFLFATALDTGLNLMLGSKSAQGKPVQNEELVLGRLILRFHRHNRGAFDNVDFKYYDTCQQFMISDNIDYANVDYGDVLIYSIRPRKVQKEFYIPLCCDTDFDPEEYITTQMGIGYLEQSSFNVKDSRLKLNLKYKTAPDNEIITPDDIDGLTLWLEADTDVTEVSGKVSSWGDQSVNGFDATQGTAARRPTKVLNQINGLPIIRFLNSDNTYLSTTSFQAFPSKRGTVFVLSRYVATGQIIGTWDGVIDPDKKWDINIETGVVTGVEGNNYGSYVEEKAFASYNSFAASSYGWDEFLLFNLNRDSDTSQHSWINGKPGIVAGDNASGTPAGVNPMPLTGQPNLLPIHIGSDTLTDAFSGDIALILIYNRSLSDIERQQVERYIANKYALNLYHIY